MRNITHYEGLADCQCQDYHFALGSSCERYLPGDCVGHDFEGKVGGCHGGVEKANRVGLGGTV